MGMRARLVGHIRAKSGPATLSPDSAALCSVLYQEAGPLISDRAIVRAARLVIKYHRREAPLRAAERVIVFLEAGKMTRAATWRRILKAIDELAKVRKAPGQLRRGNTTPPRGREARLSEPGISKSQSSRWQAVARLFFGLLGLSH